MDKPAPPNRLALETSPYLLQHAHNPVDWHPWGEEAFALARTTGRPILLSIGYATCHWCHVMEKESFTSSEVARELKQHFVAIKVDREERPDVDAVYMAATQAMNGGRGGWPMTVLLTPELEPFFAGTYLPPHGQGGALGFLPLLRHVAQLWRDAPDQLRHDATALTQFLRHHHAAPAGQAAPAAAKGWAAPLAEAACEAAMEDFDAAHGGFGAPPKFLATPTLRLLLRCSRGVGGRPYGAAVRRTLLGMARGGLWDWVAGGFSRYSTDAAFRVPHFEKMAYDNALMVQLLLEAYQHDGDARWASLAVQTLRFVDDELGGEDGGFLCAVDADSEGEEGRYYVWTHAQAHDALAPVLGEAASEAWLGALGVRPEGNWEGGRNVLFAAGGLAPVPEGPADAAVRNERGPGAVADVAAPACTDAVAWPEVRAHLARARAGRVRPITDDKVLAGHNGLLIEAFARAAAVLGEPRYLARACAAADFVWRQLWQEGGLRRSWRGVAGGMRGVLEDYAYLTRGLVLLYEAGAPAHYVARAQRLADRVDAAFAEPGSGVLFDSEHSERDLLFRPRTDHDGATPSPAAAMAWGWRRLAWHTGNAGYAKLAARAVAALQPAATRHPESHATLLAFGLDEGQAPVQVSWLGAGPPMSSPLWLAAHAACLPHAVFAHGASPPEGPDAARAPGESGWPLLAGRPPGGGPHGALYVCAGERCSPPLTRASEVREALAALVPSV